MAFEKKKDSTSPDLLKEKLLSQKENSESKGKKRSGKLPTKRSINLALVGLKKKNYFLRGLGILCVVALVAVLGKYAILDRIIQVTDAYRELAGLQDTLAEYNRQEEEIGDISDEYAHYTYTGLTTEEISYVNRIDLLDLLERVIYPDAIVSSWSISGNQLNLPVRSNTLQEINELVQKLEQEPLVEYCTVTTAVSETENYSVVVETEKKEETEKTGKTGRRKETSSAETTALDDAGSEAANDVPSDETEAEPENETGSEIQSEDITEAESEPEMETEPMTEILVREIVTGQITVYLNSMLTGAEAALVEGGVVQ